MYYIFLSFLIFTFSKSTLLFVNSAAAFHAYVGTCYRRGKVAFNWALSGQFQCMCLAPNSSIFSMIALHYFCHCQFMMVRSSHIHSNTFLIIRSGLVQMFLNSISWAVWVISFWTTCKLPSPLHVSSHIKCLLFYKVLERQFQTLQVPYAATLFSAFGFLVQPSVGLLP